METSKTKQVVMLDKLNEAKALLWKFLFYVLKRKLINKNKRNVQDIKPSIAYWKSFKYQEENDKIFSNLLHRQNYSDII